MERGSMQEASEFLDVSRRAFIGGAVATGVLMVGSMALSGCGADVESENGVDEPATAESADRQWAFEIAPEQIADSSIAKTIDTEVLVIGGGPAGFVAANTAAEAGAKVTLIASSDAPVNHGGEYFGFASDAMIGAGVNIVDPYETTKQRLRDNSFRVSQEKWFLLANKNTEAINWLDGIMKAAGFTTSFGDEFIVPETGETLVYSGTHKWASEEFPFATSGEGVIVTLSRLAETNGVSVNFNVTAKQLLRDDGNTGRVVAAVAIDANGDYIKYTASKGIVLATGDFTADADMLAKYAPEYSDLGYGGVYTGDGHKMALWIGAAWQRTYPCGIMAGSLSGGSAAFNDSLPFFGLTVNTKGERYGNECSATGGAALAQLRQPDGIAICIWDAAYGTKAPGPWSESWARGSEPTALLDEWKAAAAGDPMIVPGTPPLTTISADTVEELAGVLSEVYGTDTATLTATIKRYNELCTAGKDDDFGKPARYLQTIVEPPFFARYGKPSFLIATGGLRTDTSMRVLDADDVPIGGLYAAGTIVGDMYDNYDFAQGGIHLGGNCLTFGRIAGKEVAHV